MTRNLPITAIELEGFQCFEQPTRIEFAPITLLYGPNSAGKSAIFDALELAEGFWSPLDKKHEKFSSLVKRWTRRTNVNGDGGYRNLRIAIEFPLNLDWPFDPKAKIADLANIEPQLKQELESKYGYYNFGEPQLFEALDDGSYSELPTIKKFHEELHQKNVRMEFVIRVDERGNLNRGYSLERYSVHLGEQILIEGL